MRKQAIVTTSAVTLVCFFLFAAQKKLWNMNLGGITPPSDNLLRFFTIQHAPRKLTDKSSGIMIAVNLANESKLAEAQIETWVTAASHKISTIFIACPDHGDLLSTVRNLVLDPEYPCQEYPPVRSWLVAFKVMSRYNHIKWYLKCDEDSYVNTREVASYFHELEMRGVDPDKPYYFGSPGYGRAVERHLLGLNNKSFAMGGPCVGMSAGAMKILVPVVDECMMKPIERMHSDTQLARCFQDLDILNALPFHTDKDLRDLFKQMYENKFVLNDGSLSIPYSGSTVPPILPAFKVTPLSLHSIKDPSLMLAVHAQIHYDAVPMSPDKPRSYFEERRCFHNPAMAAALTTCKSYQNLTGIEESPTISSYPGKCSVAAQECPVATQATHDAAASGINTTIAAAVLVCERPEDCISGPLATALRAQGIMSVEAVPAMSGGESEGPGEGRAALHAALVAGRDRAEGGGVLVMEEGARLHRDFAGRLARALAASRCRCQLAAGGGCPPGVLHLGMAVDSPAARRHYADGAAAADADAAACANVLPGTAGGFATVYGAEVVPFALAWLDSDRGGEGLGELFTHLSLLGLVVRGLPEPVAIAGLDGDGGGVLGVLPPVREKEDARWGWRRGEFA